MAVGFASPDTKKNLRIRLELTEPNEDDAGLWSLVATATVTDSDNKPLSNVEVQFFHNGTRVGDPEHTDSDGQVTKEFNDLSKGNHTFVAIVVDEKGKLTTIKKQQTKKIKEEKPKKVAELLEHRVRVGDTVKFTFTALTEDRLPAKNVQIVVLDPDLPGGSKPAGKTNRDGVVEYEVALTKDRFFSVVAVGSDVRIPIRVYR